MLSWTKVSSYEAELLRRHGFLVYRPLRTTDVESREISEGVVVDYDANGNLVGIDIDNASKKVQLQELILNKLPSEVQTVAA